MIAYALFHNAAAGSSLCGMKNSNHKKRGTQSDTSLGRSHHCEYCPCVHRVYPFLNSSSHIVDTCSIVYRLHWCVYCMSSVSIRALLVEYSVWNAYFSRVLIYLDESRHPNVRLSCTHLSRTHPLQCHSNVRMHVQLLDLVRPSIATVWKNGRAHTIQLAGSRCHNGIKRKICSICIARITAGRKYKV